MANQKQPEKTDKKAAASTQAYLNIQEIKDGVVVLKDGSLHVALMASALNFALKSASEQDAIIYAYQRFLNSLTFPVQILVQSRRIDLDYYLEKLRKRADEQKVELVSTQIFEYTEFIKRLISVTNIMDKRFFVIVPFFPAATQQLSSFAKLFSTKNAKKTSGKETEESFKKNKVQLMQRVEAIASALGSIGLRAVALNSEELVELFYNVYNPSTSTKQRPVNVDQLTSATIRRTGSETTGSDMAAPASSSYTPATDEPPITGEPTAPIQSANKEPSSQTASGNEGEAK